jgi:hypothetical protein
MEHSLATSAETYADRAAIEAELKADTGGLQRHRRRQQRLAWTRGWMFRDSPFADAGIHRMVKELLPIPGKVVVEEGHSVKLRLKTSHLLAKPMLVCLARLVDRLTPRNFAQTLGHNIHVRPLACAHGRFLRPHAHRPQPGPSEAAGSWRSPPPHHSPGARQRVRALRHTAGCGGLSSALTSTSSSASRLGPSIITARVSPSS